MMPLFHAVFEEDARESLKQLRESLENDSATLRHPARDLETYVLCDSPDGASERAADFAEDPNYPFDTNGMIIIEDNILTVGSLGPVEIFDKLQALVLPILEKYKCRIVDECGHEWTDRYAGRFHTLFREH